MYRVWTSRTSLLALFVSTRSDMQAYERLAGHVSSQGLAISWDNQPMIGNCLLNGTLNNERSLQDSGGGKYNGYPSDLPEAFSSHKAPSASFDFHQPSSGL